MGRQAKGWWDRRTQRWYARLGPLDKNGRPLPVMLRDEQQNPIVDPPQGDRVPRSVEKAVHRLKLERENRSAVIEGPTVDHVCSLYLDWHRTAAKSAMRTIRGHWYQLTRFCRFEHNGIRYGDRPAETIGPRDLWRIDDSGGGSLRQLYASVVACWNWAARPVKNRDPEVLIPANRLTKIERPAKGHIQDKTIDWGDARVMLRLARGYARQKADTRAEKTRAARWLKVATLTAMAYTGARTLEIVSLEWNDIRWKDGILYIPATRTKTRYTGKPRIIGMQPRLVRLLRAIQNWKHRHPVYVFYCAWHSTEGVKDHADNRERELWKFVREGVKPWLTAEWERRRVYLEPRGINLTRDWTPYWLRHTYGTTALEEVGADVASSIMGNSAEIMRNTYDHVSARRARNVADRVHEARKRLRETGDE